MRFCFAFKNFIITEFKFSRCQRLVYQKFSNIFKSSSGIAK